MDSNANYVAAAFSKLDFFVVQDIFFSATCRFADVVLPASPSLEKEGTFTSTERRIQRLLSGVRAASGQPAGLEDYAGYRQPSWRQLELRASLGDHERNGFAHADARGSELRTARRLQVPAVARGRRWKRSAIALHEEI